MEEVEGVVMAQVYMGDFLIESPTTVDMAAHRKTASIRKLHQLAALACLQEPLVRRDPDLSMISPLRKLQIMFLYHLSAPLRYCRHCLLQVLVGLMEIAVGVVFAVSKVQSLHCEPKRTLHLVFPTLGVKQREGLVVE